MRPDDDDFAGARFTGHFDLDVAHFGAVDDEPLRRCFVAQTGERDFDVAGGGFELGRMKQVVLAARDRHHMTAQILDR
jgi:hypothetical protein